MAAGALGVALAATAAAGLALTPRGPGPAPAVRARPQAAVTIVPGVRHLRREPRQDPSTTAQCQQSIQIACYNPVQIEQAYDLPSLFSRGITGRGTTIVIVDPYGSPTIVSDLRDFDRTENVPDPPSLQIIRPAGRVPAYHPDNAGMVGWASEATLDVEYAHTMAPGRPVRVQPGRRPRYRGRPVLGHRTGPPGRPLKLGRLAGDKKNADMRLIAQIGR